MTDDTQTHSGLEDTPSPYRTLDTIRDAGVALVAVASERLREVEEALFSGRFDDAFDRTQELLAKLAPLAQAETQIGVLKGARVVRARDVEVGMSVIHRGTVAEVEVDEEPCRSGHHTHLWVKLTFENETTVRFDADSEIAVGG